MKFLLFISFWTLLMAVVEKVKYSLVVSLCITNQKGTLTDTKDVDSEGNIFAKSYFYSISFLITFYEHADKHWLAFAYSFFAPISILLVPKLKEPYFVLR